MWILFALGCSFITAFYTSINHLFKLPASQMMVYRGIGCALFMLPFLAFLPANFPPQFYILCVLQGLVVAYTDNRILNAAKNWGNDVTAAIQPLSVVATFLLWLIIVPSTVRTYLASPVTTVLIILCLTGIVYATLKLKQASLSAQALKSFILPLCLMACADVLNKKAMQAAGPNLIAAIFYYSFFVSLFCGLPNLLTYVRHNAIKDLFNKRSVFAGLCVITIIFLVMGTKNVAMRYTPNPAYTAAIICLFPLWIFGEKYLRAFVKKQPYQAFISPLTLIILVVSLCGLLLLS